MINGNEFLKRKYPEMPDENFQPSGLDLNLGAVYELDNSEPVYSLLEDKKNIPKHLICEKDIYFKKEEGRDGWILFPNKPYILEVDRQVDIGNSAQMYLPRSTLLRAGVNIMTALGDLGYCGKLSFLAINYHSKPFFIEEGVRFAQLVDFRVVDSSFVYNGDYQNDKHKQK